MEQLCNICNRTTENFPTTELLCHHICHTFCFLNNIQTAQDNLHFLACVTCERPVFGNEVAEEEDDEDAETEYELVDDAVAVQQPDNIVMTDENNQTNRVNRLFERNEQFRKDLKKYMLASRSCSKPRKAFQKLVTAKKAELKPRYEQIKAMYEGLYHTKKNEIVSSDEYKNYRRADAQVRRYWNIIRTKYDVRGYAIEALRTKKGFKTLRRPYSPYRRSSQGIIRRALRLHIPWY